MPKAESLKFKHTLDVPPADVFRAFVHATALRDWLANAAQAEPRVGGRLYLWWDENYAVTGTYTALEPGRKVAFSWHGQGEPEPSRVQVTLKERKGGTALTLTHSGFGSGRKWAPHRSSFERGWPDHLANLQSMLETGIDARTLRRPRMGIFIGDFNPAIASELGVPVKAGIRLEGTAEGSGARAAGLQKDDVIVQLGGKKAVDFASVGRALSGRQAGDQIKVTYYRGSQKQTALMQLSAPPPPPELPGTAAELVEVASKTYAGVQKEFSRLLEGVSEAEAERRPAPREWNLKELIAHFIACERDLQAWIADMLNDNVVGDSLEFRPNVTPRLTGLVERYPTLPALLAELKCSADETLRLLAGLPPEFIAQRKHMYQRVVQWMVLVVPGHLPDEHGEQLKATLTAARA